MIIVHISSLEVAAKVFLESSPFAQNVFTFCRMDELCGVELGEGKAPTLWNFSNVFREMGNGGNF